MLVRDWINKLLNLDLDSDLTVVYDGNNEVGCSYSYGEYDANDIVPCCSDMNALLNNDGNHTHHVIICH